MLIMRLTNRIRHSAFSVQYMEEDTLISVLNRFSAAWASACFCETVAAGEMERRKRKSCGVQTTLLAYIHTRTCIQ